MSRSATASLAALGVNPASGPGAVGCPCRSLPAASPPAPASAVPC
ncbi:hypothetical protein [Lentzea guizhouensis]|nr:hypothetical protein [Lentzea guizhouensis]